MPFGRSTRGVRVVSFKCGMEHAFAIQEVVTDGELEDKALHPWRYTGEREDAGLPF